MMYLAEESKGTNNFLIPNGTFIVCLLIFVLVFLVIKFMVVPPILKVLAERDERVAKTIEDNKAATASYEAATTEYESAMKDARAAGTSIRDEARAKGNEELSEAKRRATEESDAALASANAALKADGESAAAVAREDVSRLSETLAARVLGQPAKATTSTETVS